jgi:MucB/RseB N-terminal domain
LDNNGFLCKDGIRKLFRNNEIANTEVNIMTLVSRDDPDNPVAIALRNYRNITTYQVTLRSKSKNSIEEIRYYYKSAYIRMEFIKPVPGVVLIYNPVKKEVRLRTFSFINHVVTLSPDNEMIQSSAGHKVNESDIGSLLGIVEKLQSNGKTCIMGDESLSGRHTLLVRVTGIEDFIICGIHRYDLWLDKTTYLPLKIVSYDLREEVIEEVLMDDLEIDLELPDNLFNL